MISDKLPTTTTEVIETIPKEPFNWKLLIICSVIALLIIGLICAIVGIRKHIKHKYFQYFETRKLRKKNNNDEFYKIVCMGFKQFHDYYSINPERYHLSHAKVMVYSDEYLNGETERYGDTYSYCIIFKFKDYKKYRNWIEKFTNGMSDPSAVTDTLNFLKVVESDIQAIREKEAISVNEAQKTMQEVMGRLKDEFLDLEKETQEE